MAGHLEVRRGYMSEEQLKRFLEASRDPREKLWWLLMCDCGLRLGEVQSLGLWEIQRQHVHVRGKGKKWRRVPVTRRVWEAVVQARTGKGAGQASMVCPVSPRAVQARFHRAQKRAGLSGLRLSPHSLRHTFATRLLTAGVDIYRVQTMLGHRSIRTTVGYLHTSPEALREASAALDDLNGA